MQAVLLGMPIGTAFIPVVDAYLNFDMDTSETQALTHDTSDFHSFAVHQRSWQTSRTRLGTGHAERLEVHNNTGDWWTDSRFRSQMVAADTNDGGITSNGVVGFRDVYWAWSSYLPATPDPDAEVAAGFRQTTVPDYEHLWEIHERVNVNGSTVGIDDLNTVSNIAVMARDGQLQFRIRCGVWTWNGSSWNAPAFNTFTPGTNGSNDQIPIPIVKASGTNATMVMNTWIDVIVHVRFSTGADGLVEVWAREAGQLFSDAANLTINGPTHKAVLGSDGVLRTSADYEAATLTTGCYMQLGLYTGSGTWTDASNSAHVHIFDELRRHNSLAEAKANWG